MNKPQPRPHSSKIDNISATAEDDIRLSEHSFFLPKFLKFLATLAVASAMPLLYLNGSAYHEGYLSQLGLVPSMFPLDTAGTLTHGVLAWYIGLAKGVTFIAEFEARSLWKVGLAFLFASLLTGTWLWLAQKKTVKENKPTPEKKQQSDKSSFLQWASKVRNSAFYIFLTGYGFIVLSFSLTLMISALVIPFLNVGKSVATEELAKKFLRSPIAHMAMGSEAKRPYRIIQCSESFCALYTEGSIVTVPISKIEFATSSLK